MDDVYDESTDNGPGGETSETTAAPAAAPEKGDRQATEREKALVKRIQACIKADKRHFRKHFARMERDMFMALNGHDPDWPEKNYSANIVGSHINRKTASIYAKNPKMVARRKEMLDFAVWDETPESLMTAMQVVQSNQALIQAHAIATQQAQMAMSGMMPAPQVDPATGQPIPPLGTGGPMPPAPVPPLPPEVLNAQAILADVQEGMKRKQTAKKFGKTLELLFANCMRQQVPLDFKSLMKTIVRRTATTSVGYVEMGFQREYGVPNDVNNELNDCRDRLNHLQSLMEEASEDELDDCEAEKAELELMIANLEAQPQVCIRKGLTFKAIQSTKLIPDRHCMLLGGFAGAKHLTIEEVMTKKDCEEKFRVDLGHGYTPYNISGRREGELRGVDMGDDEYQGVFAVDKTENDMVAVYKHYDKRTGLVYWLVDGHDKFLMEPAAPDVQVPRFWPVYSLTFNPVESETELFGKSDVALLRHQQNEVNRSRQGKREHRQAARPRFVYSEGSLDPEKDIPLLEEVGAFEFIGVTGDPQTDIAKRLQPFPMPGVDPNLYDTNEVMQDGVMTVGAAPSQLGATSKSTATEAAIADGAVSANDGSSIDDLDAFMTAIARDGAIILMENMTKEEVVEVVGPGAVWVEDLGMTVEQIYNEVYLEVEAGSSGKPNQPLEIRNFKELGPLLMQMPGIPPKKLVEEAVRRLDDRLDLTEWFAEGIPAVVAMNRQSQPMQGGADPATEDPNQQGDKGGDKGPPPGGPTGSGPGMGDNRI